MVVPEIPKVKHLLTSLLGFWHKRGSGILSQVRLVGVKCRHETKHEGTNSTLLFAARQNLNSNHGEPTFRGELFKIKVTLP